MFKYLDKDEIGVVDFLSWSRGLRLHDVPQVPHELFILLTVNSSCKTLQILQVLFPS